MPSYHAIGNTVAWHNQCVIRAAHDGKVGCNTVEYKTAFLYSDWLYFLWHGIKLNIRNIVMFDCACAWNDRTSQSCVQLKLCRKYETNGQATSTSTTNMILTWTSVFIAVFNLSRWTNIRTIFSSMLWYRIDTLPMTTFSSSSTCNGTVCPLLPFSITSVNLTTNEKYQSN